MVYLDYQSTTPVDGEVLKAVLPYMTEFYFNPASQNSYGYKVNKAIENARTIIGKAINCKQNEIFFTSGASESINMVLKGFYENKNSGHIVTLKTEHSAILNTCKYLESKGINVTYLDVNEDGLVDIEKLSNAITSKTDFVLIMHVNNEIGVVQPIEEIGEICKKSGAIFFVDAAQSFGKIEIDVQKCNISVLVLSGHKIYSIKGTGAVYINNKIKNDFSPLIHGGGQEYGLRSGTLNVPGIVGLSKATEISIDSIKTEQLRILGLRNLFLNIIEEQVLDFKINGCLKNRLAGNLSLTFKDVSSETIIDKLEDIIVSRGSACNSLKNKGSHVLKALGLTSDEAESTIRISIGRYTTDEEITFAAKKISLTVNNIRQISNL